MRVILVTHLKEQSSNGKNLMRTILRRIMFVKWVDDRKKKKNLLRAMDQGYK